MYLVDNQKVAEAIGADSRTFRALLEFENFSISGADVGRTTIEHTMSDDETLSIGNVIAKRVEIKLYGNRAVHKGDSFKLSLYLLDFDGERTVRATHKDLSQWTHRELSMFTHEEIAFLGKTKDPDGVPLENVFIPMGEFVITKVTMQGVETTIVAYDRLAFSDKTYNPSIEFPADSADVTDDVLQQLGIEDREVVADGNLLTDIGLKVMTADEGELLCSAEYTFTISEMPQGKSCRQMLSGLAAMYGGNAILNRNGEYTTAFISNAGAFFEQDRIDEPETAAEDISVSGIRCIIDEETELTIGNPDGAYAVEFECPYMTQERLKEIWRSISYFRWRPAQVHERLADPRRDIGDLRFYRQNGKKMNIPIMALVYHFDGGLSADITACGNIDEPDLQLEVEEF